MTQFATQLLNGLAAWEFALFLMSAGLTLVLGIMNFVNLAHGSFFMIAAYVAATTYKYTQSFILAGVAAWSPAPSRSASLWKRSVCASFMIAITWHKCLRLLRLYAFLQRGSSDHLGTCRNLRRRAAVPLRARSEIVPGLGSTQPIAWSCWRWGCHWVLGLYGVKIVKPHAMDLAALAAVTYRHCGKMGITVSCTSALAVFGAGAALAGLAVLHG